MTGILATMRKGMIFSMDAVLALIVVIILASWLPQQLNAISEKNRVSDEISRKALDEAIMGFYDMVIEGEEAPADESISAGAKFGKCYVVYTLNPNNDFAARAEAEPHTFCEEMA